MDRLMLASLAIISIAFLLRLPSWTPVEPVLKLNSATTDGRLVSFSLSYAAPWAKSCYVVVYGPFTIDGPGHEEGNNIYVLNSRTGTLSDQLLLQQGANLTEFRAELWCDDNKLREVSSSFG